MKTRFNFDETETGWRISDAESREVVLDELPSEEAAEAIAAVLGEVPAAGDLTREFVAHCAAVFQRTKGNAGRCVDIIQAEQEARRRAGMRINERFTPYDHGRLELATRVGSRY